MRRLHTPAALSLAACLSLSTACEMEDFTGLEDIESDSAALEFGPGGDEGEEEEEPHPPIIWQSRWLRAPRSLYTRTSLTGIKFGFWSLLSTEVGSNGVSGTRFGRQIEGTALRGAQVSMEFMVPYSRQGVWPAVRDYAIRDVATLAELAALPSSDKLPTTHASVAAEELYLYKLEALGDYDGDGAGDGFLCNAPPYDAGNPIWQYAIAVPVEWSWGERTASGVWVSPGQARPTATTGKFTFACLNSAAAKCRLWGYEVEPAPGGRVTAKSLAAVNACTRMAMADYCGTGGAYTLDGTEVDFFDNQNVNRSSFHNGVRKVFEARWGKKGAYCMSNYRIKNSMRVAGWLDGQPMRMANPDYPDAVPAGFCQGTSPYGHPIRECPGDDIYDIQINREDFGYNRYNDVVLSNSSESNLWFVQAVPLDAVISSELEQEAGIGSDDGAGGTIVVATPLPTKKLPESEPEQPPAKPPIHSFPTKSPSRRDPGGGRFPN